MNLTAIGVLETGVPRRPGVPANPRTTLTFQQGVSLMFTVPIVSPDGANVVLGTHDTVVWNIKKKPTDNPPLVSKVAVNTQGQAVFALLPSDTKQMDAGRYVWDVWLIRVIGVDTFRDPVIPQSPLVLEASVAPIP